MGFQISSLGGARLREDVHCNMGKCVCPAHVVDECSEADKTGR